MIPATFEHSELEHLRGIFRLRQADEASLNALALSDLLDVQQCQQLLDRLGPVIGAPNRVVTASLLAKRLAFLTTGACLYGMSVFDKGLRLSPENACLEYAHDGRQWVSTMPLHSIQPLAPVSGQRDAWREQLVRGLFEQLLMPLWGALRQASGVSLRILWENTAVRVYSLYDRRMADLQGEARRRAEQDFHWLLEQAEPELFGLDYNPLQRFRSPISCVEEREVRFRRTCCFYFKATSPAEYCSTCPLLCPRKQRHNASR